MLTAEQVAARLKTDAKRGLSAADADARLRRHGLNALQRSRGPGPLLTFARQFAEPLIVLLIIAAILSYFFTHEVTDAIVICVIIILNAIIGFTQERRAQRALEGLHALAEPNARIIREGRHIEVAAHEVVPGDLLVLEAGMRVVADARLIQEASLQCNETMLTGEAYPVSKHVDPVPDEHAVLGDRCSMVYSGTSVTMGRGRAVIVATGMQTELGRIAEMLQEAVATTTPLQRRLRHVGAVLGAAALAICAVVLVVGVCRGREWDRMLLTAIALAVAAVPEGLPAVITVSLALGSQQMVRRHALIRRLPAVETLGSVTVIATDKTGTLTEGAMRPALLYTLDGTHRLEDGAWRAVDGAADGLDDLLCAVALCNDAHLPVADDGAPDYANALGEPTEIALLGAAMAAAVDPNVLTDARPRVAEIPFDSDRKRMTTIHSVGAEGAGGYVAMVKGAPDQLLPRCTACRSGGEDHALTEPVQEQIASQYMKWASEGLRVLAAAHRPLDDVPEKLAADDVESDLVFLGLVALVDPPRAEVSKAVAKAREAGIRTVMVTGDYAATAERVADEIGLHRQGGRLLSGHEMQAMETEDLIPIVDEVDVYARISPADKVKVVEAWRARGEIVAVTGDGVNDAAALQRADIGVAMGQTGTEVCRDASDMVLLDDNYSSIVAAVEQGRVIYDNIRKFVVSMVATNSGEIWTIFFSIAFGWPLPLVPVQILWVNLITDGLPAVALGFEPAEGDVMRRPPRPARESLFARGTGWRILWTGFLMALIVLGLFWWRGMDGENLIHARTLAFFVLGGMQLAYVLSVRKEREPVGVRNFCTNPRLLAAVGISLAGQLAVTYVPFLQKVFHTVALTPSELAIAIAACVLLFLFSELMKRVEARREVRRQEAAA